MYDLYRSRRFPNPVSARPFFLPLFTNVLEQEFSEVRNGQATPKQPHKYVVWVIYRPTTRATVVATTTNTTNVAGPSPP